MAPSTPASSRRSLHLLSLFVIVGSATAFAHWRALSAGAISFDDDQYFVRNAVVRDPSWASARRFFSEVLEPSTVNGYYQPLTMVSVMVDVAWGARPDDLLPFHRTSLALHIANTLLIATLLYTLFGSAGTAAGLALLFGVHPMTVETIPWIGERKTLLATFFALLSIIAYVQYAGGAAWLGPSSEAVRAHSAKNRRPAAYVASLLFFILALLAKPTVTPLPAMLLCMDLWPLRRLSWRSMTEKIPFFLIAAASAVITLISQARTASITLPTEYQRMQVPLMLCHNNIFYLWKMVWPVALTSHYPMPRPFDFSVPMIRAGVIGTFVLWGAIAISLRWTWAPAAAWLAYFIGLLPTMQIVGFTNVVASDKYAYFPSIALLMLLCGAGAHLFARFSKNTITMMAVGAAVVIAAIMETRATRAYLSAWRDTQTLYRRMIALAPMAPTLQSHLGNVLLDEGLVDDALAVHIRAVQIGPNSPEAQNDLGNALRAKGRLDQAMAQYEKALRLFPDYHVAHRNLGVALADQGRFAEAVTRLETAARLQPRSDETRECLAKAHNNWAIALDQRGDAAQAVSHFQAAVRISPSYSEARYNLAQALRKLGRLDEAAEQLGEVIRLNPNDDDARRLLDELRHAQPRGRAPP